MILGPCGGSAACLRRDSKSNPRLHFSPPLPLPLRSTRGRRGGGGGGMAGGAWAVEQAGPRPPRPTSVTSRLSGPPPPAAAAAGGGRPVGRPRCSSTAARRCPSLPPSLLRSRAGGTGAPRPTRPAREAPGRAARALPPRPPPTVPAAGDYFNSRRPTSKLKARQREGLGASPRGRALVARARAPRVMVNKIDSL